LAKKSSKELAETLKVSISSLSSNSVSGVRLSECVASTVILMKKSVSPDIPGELALRGVTLITVPV
jgi:hypothetical protein